MANNETSNEASQRLDERLDAAIKAAVARDEKVETLSSWWRQVREENNFRSSLAELFSGE